MSEKYKVVVEQLWPESRDTPTKSWAIVIYRPDGECAGIPERGLTQSQAEKARRVSAFSFEFGLMEMRRIAYRATPPEVDRE